MKYQDILNRIKNDDLRDDITQLTDAMHAKVYLYNKDPKLIIKILLGNQTQKEDFRTNLFNDIYREDTLCSLIYDHGLIDIKDVTFTYSIQSFLEGSQITKYPNDNLSKQVVEGVYNFSKRLKEASSEYTELGIPSVYQIFTYLSNTAPDCFLKEKLNQLLEDEKFHAYYDTNEQYLFHGDLWRANILINESTISIIDVEPTFYGPKHMQFATMMGAYFLLSKILFDGNDHIDYNYLVSIWPEELHKEEILYLMYYFPIVIGLGKEQMFLGNPVSDQTYNNIMSPLYMIIEWIEKKLKNN